MEVILPNGGRSFMKHMTSCKLRIYTCWNYKSQNQEQRCWSWGINWRGLIWIRKRIRILSVKQLFWWRLTLGSLRTLTLTPHRVRRSSVSWRCSFGMMMERIRSFGERILRSRSPIWTSTTSSRLLSHAGRSCSALKWNWRKVGRLVGKSLKFP